MIQRPADKKEEQQGHGRVEPCFSDISVILQGNIGGFGGRLLAAGAKGVEDGAHEEGGHCQQTPTVGEVSHCSIGFHEIHTASRCVLVNLPDGDLAIIQTNSDVSALKQAQDAVKSREAHLSSILDTVPDAMAEDIQQAKAKPPLRDYGYLGQNPCRGSSLSVSLPRLRFGQTFSS